MRAGEGGGKAETIWGGGRKYIYLDEAGFREIEGEDEDLGVFFFGFVSDFGLGSCEEMDWVMRGGYHGC